MTTTPTTPATLLECLNMLLLAIRATPLGSLSQAEESVDSYQALNTIKQVNREFQMEGWFFNTTTEKPLEPDADGHVHLPANTLKVTKSRNASSNYAYPVTQRGLKLYDPRGSVGFAIGETVYVDLVECLAFEDLTEAARMLVTGMAARKFCLPKLPSQTTFQWTEEYVMGARRRVEQEEEEQRDQSLKDTSPHFAKHQKGKKVRG